MIPTDASTRIYRQMLLRLGCIVFAASLVAELDAADALPEYEIVIKDRHFLPAQLVVPAGTRFRIVVDNQDNEPQEFESYALNREKHIGPRSRAVLYLGPLEPGRYLYQGETPLEDGGPAAPAGESAPLGVIEAR